MDEATLCQYRYWVGAGGSGCVLGMGMTTDEPRADGVIKIGYPEDLDWEVEACAHLRSAGLGEDARFVLPVCLHTALPLTRHLQLAWSYKFTEYYIDEPVTVLHMPHMAEALQQKFQFKTPHRDTLQHMLNVAGAVLAMHSVAHMAHMDLTLVNMVLDSDRKTARLIDFGSVFMCAWFALGEHTSQDQNLAPEVAMLRTIAENKPWDTSNPVLQRLAAEYAVNRAYVDARCEGDPDSREAVMKQASMQPSPLLEFGKRLDVFTLGRSFYPHVHDFIPDIVLAMMDVDPWARPTMQQVVDRLQTAVSSQQSSDHVCCALI